MAAKITKRTTKDLEIITSIDDEDFLHNEVTIRHKETELNLAGVSWNWKDGVDVWWRSGCDGFSIGEAKIMADAVRIACRIAAQWEKEKSGV